MEFTMFQIGIILICGVLLIVYIADRICSCIEKCSMYRSLIKSLPIPVSVKPGDITKFYEVLNDCIEKSRE